MGKAPSANIQAPEKLQNSIIKLQRIGSSDWPGWSVGHSVASLPGGAQAAKEPKRTGVDGESDGQVEKKDAP